MRRFSKLMVLGIVALGATFSLHAEKGAAGASGSSKAGAKSTAAVKAPLADTSADYALWSNPAAFEKLSSGGQARIVAKYGVPGGKGPQAKPHTGVAPNLAPPNFLVNDPTLDVFPLDTQSETSAALGEGSNVIVAYNDSGSYVVNDQFTGFSVSTNNGVNWTDKGTLPYDPSVGDAGDPTLARSAKTGTIGFTTLQFYGAGVNFFRSAGPNPAIFTGGNFDPAVNAGPGFNQVSDFLDKTWLTADNTPGATGSGFGNFYCVYRLFSGTGEGGIYFTRSTDDGLTWGPSPGVQIINSEQGAWVTVGADHAVYAFWHQSYDSAAGNSPEIRMRKSTDQGLSWGPVVTAASLIGRGVNGNLGITTGFRSNSFPQVVNHPTLANVLYLVFNDVVSTAAGADSNCYFVTSTDGGSTWSAKTTINTVTNRYQYFPTIAVSPAGNYLYVGWYDQRRDAANFLIDRWGRIATIDGAGVATFQAADFLVTTKQFRPYFGQDPVVNTTYMGDYDQARMDDDYIYDTWGDNSIATVLKPSGQADIRQARIPVAGPGPNLVYTSTALGAGNGDQNVNVGECNTVRVTLSNLGNASATAISTVLTTSTPGVTIQSIPQGMPNIAAGGSGATNAPGFYVTTSPAIACGTVIDFTLIVTTAEGLFTIPFSLTVVSTAAPGAPTVFTSVDIPKTINDNATIDSNNIVAGLVGTVAKVTASIYITHTWDSDLTISLIAPNGTTVALANRRGSSANNFGTACGTPTTFDDAGATAIGAGSAPFVAANPYRPETPLSVYANLPAAVANGTWKLRVNDAATGDTGAIQCWSLSISTTPCAGPANALCPLQAICDAVPTSGTAPLNVAFTGSAIGGSGTYSYSWDFGDGSPTVNVANIPHVYQFPGSYNAKLTVNDGLGTATCTKVITVTQPIVTPVITAVDVLCGNMSGGRVVNITGTDFDAFVSVTLAGVPVTSIVDTPTGIQVTAGQYIPAGPAVSGPIVVTNPGPASATWTSNWTYVVRGDGNNGGFLDGGDLAAINANLNGVLALPAVCSGDANSNGFVDGGDLAYINAFLNAVVPNPGP